MKIAINRLMQSLGVKYLNELCELPADEKEWLALATPYNWRDGKVDLNRFAKYCKAVGLNWKAFVEEDEG